METRDHFVFHIVLSHIIVSILHKLSSRQVEDASAIFDF